MGKLDAVAQAVGRTLDRRPQSVAVELAGKAAVGIVAPETC